MWSVQCDCVRAIGRLIWGQGAERAGGKSPTANPLSRLSPSLSTAQDAKRAAKDAKIAKARARAAAAAAAAAAGPDPNSKKAAQKADKEAARAQEAAELTSFIDAARATPAGAKKDYSGEAPKVYDPKYVEAATYAWWEACGFFKPKPPADGCADPPFVMVIPPPNVTGSLHLGHALMAAIEDAVVRWARMRGRTTLWVPGTDHAGIATQTVVEKTLAREKGITRHVLGRDAFVAQVHEWVDKYGGTICRQLRRVGASPDWTRQAFTMDAKLTEAVKEAFLRLHTSGKVYRAHRLVNWSTQLKTAISDIEVDYVDVPAYAKIKVPGYTDTVEFGVLTSFAYPLESGDGEIVVATTRPETMLGDSAVAVHPDDPRYKALIGTHVLHPLDGRKLPIVGDAELVDMAFGTGAVKITPAHDPNDFVTGQRHNLAFVSVFDDEGRINDKGGMFAGQPRFQVRGWGGVGGGKEGFVFVFCFRSNPPSLSTPHQARITVVDWLKDKGLFRGTEGNPMRLGLCSRSGDVVEPTLKPQWWVSCGEMAKAAGDAARDGRLTIVPPESEATWHRWLDGIRDWCVSRQLWWGHRIPAFYVRLPGGTDAPGGPTEETDRWVVAADEADALAQARAKWPDHADALTVVQDEDVLDTWFSSGLFPFSVFGWPNATPDLARFYPTSLLETGHDILFFWVARMVMLGMELTGEVPFATVYLHTMVRDAHGRKMSKSLGNVIDPLHVIDGISLADLHATLAGGNLDAKEVEKAKEGQRADFPDGIDECGADALRMALVSYTTQARDINLDIKRVITYRLWCNKLWNAVRFATLNLGSGFVPEKGAPATRRPLACRWILSRLDAAAAAANTGFETHDFAAVVAAAYAFWQYELCDVFIELVKPAVYAADAAPDDAALASTATSFRQTLWRCLDSGLRLLHPLMPFVTEELWQRLPRGGAPPDPDSIMVAPYPRQSGADDANAEACMKAVLEATQCVRNARVGYSLTSRQRPPLTVLPATDAARRAFVGEGAAYLVALAPADSADVADPGAPAPKGAGVAVVSEALSVAIALAGVLDPSKEVDKLSAKREDAAKRAAAMRARTEAEGYGDKTPADVRATDAKRLAKVDAEVVLLESHIAEMQKLSLEG